MITTCNEKNLLEKVLLSEKEMVYINVEKLKHALARIKNNFTDFDDNMYLTVDSLEDISNIITGSNNITLRKVSSVKPRGYDKMYMDKDLIQDKLYQLVD